MAAATGVVPGLGAPKVTQKNVKDIYEYIGSTKGWFRLSSLISKVCAVASLHLSNIGHASAEAVAAFGNKFKAIVTASALFNAITWTKDAVGKTFDYVALAADPRGRALTALVSQWLDAITMIGFATALAAPAAAAYADIVDTAGTIVETEMSGADLWNAQAYVPGEDANTNAAVLYAGRLNLIKVVKATSSLMPVVVKAAAPYTGFTLSKMQEAVNGLFGTCCGLAADRYIDTTQTKVDFYNLG